MDAKHLCMVGLNSHCRPAQTVAGQHTDSVAQWYQDCQRAQVRSLSGLGHTWPRDLPHSLPQSARQTAIGARVFCAPSAQRGTAASPQTPPPASQPSPLDWENLHHRDHETGWRHCGTWRCVHPELLEQQRACMPTVMFVTVNKEVED